MRSLVVGVPGLAVASIAFLLAACGDANGPEKAITISLAAPGLTMAQGNVGGVGILVERMNGFEGAITLSAEGVPAGVTAAFEPASLAMGTTGSALALTIGGTAPAGTHTITVRARGEDVRDRTAIFVLTITAVPANYSLSLVPGGATLLPGTNSSVAIALTRSVSFPGPVTFALEGAPAGVTGTFAPNVTTGNSTTLSLAVAPGAVTGNHALTVRGTAAGMTDRTATFELQVLPAGGPGNITFRFCGTPFPIWVAYQNDAGAWAQVHGGATRSYSFNLTSRGGIAIVTPTPNSPGYDLVVIHATAAELAQLGTVWDRTCGLAPIAKQLAGTVAGLGATEFAEIAMGDSRDVVFNPGTTYQLDYVPAGPLDLAAVTVIETEDGYDINKVIIRRGVDIPAGSPIPVLDFGSSEAVPATRAVMTIAGLVGVEGVRMDVFHRTAAGTASALTSVLGSGPMHPYQGIPGTLLRAGDLHEASVLAVPSGPGATTARLVVDAFHTAADRTMTLGPNVAAATVTSAGTTPHARYRMQLPIQSEYAGMGLATFNQPTRSATIIATPGSSAAGATMWDLVVPDLSGATGYNTEWGLRVGTAASWTAEAANRLIYLDLADGQTLRWAGEAGSTPQAAREGSAMSALESARGARTLRHARGSLMPPR